MENQVQSNQVNTQVQPVDPVDRVKQIFAKGVEKQEKSTKLSQVIPETVKVDSAQETKDNQVQPNTEAVPESTEPETEAPKARIELQLAKAQKSLKLLESESSKMKEELGRWTETKAQFDKNPLQALERLTGKSLKDIFEAAKSGAYDEVQDNLPPEVKEKLSYLDELKKREEERQLEEAKAQEMKEREIERQEAIPKIESLLKSNMAKYPLLAKTSEVANRVVDEIYEQIDAGETPNLDKILGNLNTRVETFAKFWLSQKETLKHLISADDEIRNTLSEILGDFHPKKQQRYTSISNITEVRNRVDNPPDKKREVLDQWNRLRNSGV